MSLPAIPPLPLLTAYLAKAGAGGPAAYYLGTQLWTPGYEAYLTNIGHIGDGTPEETAALDAEATTLFNFAAAYAKMAEIGAQVIGGQNDSRYAPAAAAPAVTPAPLALAATPPVALPQTNLQTFVAVAQAVAPVATAAMAAPSIIRSTVSSPDFSRRCCRCCNSSGRRRFRKARRCWSRRSRQSSACRRERRRPRDHARAARRD